MVLCLRIPRSFRWLSDSTKLWWPGTLGLAVAPCLEVYSQKKGVRENPSWAQFFAQGGDGSGIISLEELDLAARSVWALGKA